MIKFDTLCIKPKVWSIAVLTAVAAVLIAVIITRPGFSFNACSAVMIAYLVLTIALLIRAFFRQLRFNPYSYNTLYYISFALFTFTVLLTQIMIVNMPARYGITDAQAAHSAMSTLIGSAKMFMLITSPFVLIFSVGLCISNISLIRHEGRRLVNLLGIILSVLMVGGIVVLYFSDRYVSGSLAEVMVHDILINLFACFYLYFECMLIGTMIASLIVVHHEPDKDKDYVVILGCGIRKDGTPTPLLAGRVDRAVRFYQEQLEQTGRAPVIITSGGQGPDEVMSESACMKAYLISKGIPEDHIIEEDRSTSTRENMLFSKEKMLGLGEDAAALKSKASVVFSTTNYHVFRGGLMARRAGIRAQGIGIRTKWYFWPNALVREFVGMLTEHRLKQGIILGTMVVFYTVITYIYYMYA